jgi:hypothetical protein
VVLLFRRLTLVYLPRPWFWSGDTSGKKVTNADANDGVEGAHYATQQILRVD